MKIHIINKYMKQVPATFEGTFDIEPLKQYLESEIKFYEQFSEISRDDISDEIISFLQQETCELDLFNKGDDIDSHYIENKEDVTVVNMDEILNYFSYLERLPNLTDCCKKQYYTYCAHCGKKLK